MVKLGSNAIFTGTQKGLTVIGKHCYAYSGILNVDAEITFLEFSTKRNILKVKFKL